MAKIIQKSDEIFLLKHPLGRVVNIFNECYRRVDIYL
jgi:hypothetical protein